MPRRALVACLVLAASTAAAQPARQTLQGLEREQVLREQQRDQWREDAERTRREIDELSAELSELMAAQARGEVTVSERRLRLAVLNVRENELAARAGVNQNRLARLLGALQTFSRNPPPALLTDAENAKGAVRAQILIRAVTPDLQARAKVFAEEAAQARRVRRQAAAEAEALFTAESDVADRAGQIERLLAQKQSMERGLFAEALIADRDLAVLAERATALRAVVGGLPPAPRPVPAIAGRLTLAPPVPGPPYRRYGQVERSGSQSEGWTWRPEPGAVVASPAAGIVDFAGPVEGWSNVVILTAGEGHHLVLAGLDLITVRAGQSVAQGQQLARMANNSVFSLGSEAPELRLEVRKNGVPVDPARFLISRAG
jgi:septal ring factor EnvC (AmiA/AmiB activator)